MNMGKFHLNQIEKREGLVHGMRNHVRNALTCHTTKAKRSLCEAARFELQIRKEGLFCILLVN